MAGRGLHTLATRLKQHEANGLAIAQWLEQQPEVDRVFHPALPSCPGHTFLYVILMAVMAYSLFN